MEGLDTGIDTGFFSPDISHIPGIPAPRQKAEVGSAALSSSPPPPAVLRSGSDRFISLFHPENGRTEAYRWLTDQLGVPPKGLILVPR